MTEQDQTEQPTSPPVDRRGRELIQGIVGPLAIVATIAASTAAAELNKSNLSDGHGDTAIWNSFAIAFVTQGILVCILTLCARSLRRAAFAAGFSFVFFLISSVINYFIASYSVPHWRDYAIGNMGSGDYDIPEIARPMAILVFLIGVATGWACARGRSTGAWIGLCVTLVLSSAATVGIFFHQSIATVITTIDYKSDLDSTMTAGALLALVIAIFLGIITATDAIGVGAQPTTAPIDESSAETGPESRSGLSGASQGLISTAIVTAIVVGWTASIMMVATWSYRTPTWHSLVIILVVEAVFVLAIFFWARSRRKGLIGAGLAVIFFSVNAVINILIAIDISAADSDYLYRYDESSAGWVEIGRPVALALMITGIVAGWTAARSRSLGAWVGFGFAMILPLALAVGTYFYQPIASFTVVVTPYGYWGQDLSLFAAAGLLVLLGLCLGVVTLSDTIGVAMRPKPVEVIGYPIPAYAISPFPVPPYPMQPYPMQQYRYASPMPMAYPPPMHPPRPPMPPTGEHGSGPIPASTEVGGSEARTPYPPPSPSEP